MFTRLFINNECYQNIPDRRGTKAVVVLKPLWASQGVRSALTQDLAQRAVKTTRGLIALIAVAIKFIITVRGLFRDLQ